MYIMISNDDDDDDDDAVSAAAADDDYEILSLDTMDKSSLRHVPMKSEASSTSQVRLKV